ncbi:MAG: hypothetical protein QOH57_4038 [Mycobacterium sp.]|nr:hypothetical protein [Mycobacterium sp.]
MPSRLLTRVAVAVGAAAVLIAAPAAASADPKDPEPPPLPNVNAFPPISPVDFTVMNGVWYAFGAPGGLTCIIDKGQNAYGCSGPIPAPPAGAEGANVITAPSPAEPVFANSPSPAFAAAGQVKPLPPKSRLSYRNIACAVDGEATICVNSATQHGFVLSPAGSFIA